MKRNSLVYISRLVQTAGIALIVATLLIRPTMSQNSVTDGQLVSMLPLLLLQSCCMCFWQLVSVLPLLLLQSCCLCFWRGCTPAAAALVPFHLMFLAGRWSCCCCLSALPSSYPQVLH